MLLIKIQFVTWNIKFYVQCKHLFGDALHITVVDWSSMSLTDNFGNVKISGFLLKDSRYLLVFVVGLLLLRLLPLVFLFRRTFKIWCKVECWKFWCWNVVQLHQIYAQEGGLVKTFISYIRSIRGRLRSFTSNSWIVGCCWNSVNSNQQF